MTIDSNRIIKSLLLLFLVFAALVLAKKFIVPFAIGILLAMLFIPMCNWLERHHVPKFFSAALAVLIVLLAVSGILALLSWQINGLMQDAPEIKKKLIEFYNSITGFISDKLGIPEEKQKQMMQEQQSGLGGKITGFIGSLGYTMVDCLLIVVYMAMMLFYRTHIREFILRLVSEEKRHETSVVIHQAAKVAQEYLTGLAKMIACLWVMYGIGFSIAGVKSPLFFAFLCGTLEIIPFVGNLTGSTITIFVSAAQGASAINLVGIILTYGIIQFLQGWVLEPLIVGPQVKLNPLFTIVALVIGELMWGIPGMVLAIPLTGMLKILFDHIPVLKPYGFLIGEVEQKGKKRLMERFENWLQRLFHQKRN